MPLFPTDTAQWPEQKTQLEARLDERRGMLERAGNMAEVAFLQGECATLRWMLEGAEPEYRAGAGHANYGSRAKD